MSASISSSTSAAAATSAAAPNALQKLSGNFNDFLSLLMTQLQNHSRKS